VRRKNRGWRGGVGANSLFLVGTSVVGADFLFLGGRKDSRKDTRLRMGVRVQLARKIRTLDKGGLACVRVLTKVSVCGGGVGEGEGGCGGSWRWGGGGGPTVRGGGGVKVRNFAYLRFLPRRTQCLIP